MVTKGKIVRNSEIRLIREGVVIFTGSLSSLKRFKDDVKEVQNGTECGIGIQNYDEVLENDILKFFVREKNEKKP